MKRIFYLCLFILSANQILATHSLIQPSIAYYVDIIQIRDNLNQDSAQNILYDKNESETYNIENVLNNFNNNAPISSRQSIIQNSVEGEANSGGESARNIKDEYSGISNRNDLKDSFNSLDFRYVFPSAAKLLNKRSCDESEEDSDKNSDEDEDESADDPLCDSKKWFDDPVIGSDSKKYKNLFHLRCTNLKRAKQGKSALKFLVVPDSRSKKRDERPSGSDGCKCSKIYKPVCASDGYTYKNKCFFDCQNRKLKARGFKKITILFKGKCDSLDKAF